MSEIGTFFARLGRDILFVATGRDFLDEGRVFQRNPLAEKKPRHEAIVSYTKVENKKIEKTMAELSPPDIPPAA